MRPVYLETIEIHTSELKNELICGYTGELELDNSWKMIRAACIIRRIHTAIEMYYMSTNLHIDMLAWEVPIGGRAIPQKVTFGMISGVIGSFKHPPLHVPLIIGVRPSTVKSVVSENATKEEMIVHMWNKYPDLNWPLNNRGFPLKKSEHVADALAIGEYAFNLPEAIFRIGAY